ncbi:MAG TPA: polysaccharide deacetylase family protein [Kineosporiaceae bacterium]|nr:polysaccharide deacetylase family protein [Kineosporiaceae bacterium]
MNTSAQHNVCFHGVGVPGREQEPGEDLYWVDTDRFRRILDELAGWPQVRISFDDGNASDLGIALPELSARGLTATFFVLAGRLDTPGSLGARDVRALGEQGMSVGSHGMAHRPWPGLDDAALHEELVTAREVISAAAGQPVSEAACPLGRYDRRVLSQLRRLGYRTVHTSDRACAPEGAWMQPRFSVRRDDTPESLRATVLAPPGPVTVLRGQAVRLLKRLR